MTEERDFFVPEKVDEQIDHLSQNEIHPGMLREQRSEYSAQSEKRLVRELQGYYQTDQREDIASLERAWKRVSPHLARFPQRPRSLDTPLSMDRLRISQERNRLMYNHAPEHAFKEKRTQRWPGLLAAVLVTIVLVGGLVAILNVSRQSKTANSSQGTGQAAKLTPTPTTLPIGTTIYTTPASQGSYSGFFWSPDSKRIASFTGYGSATLRIWDASTGGNAVTVSMPGQSEWITALAWSPVSQDIAVGTNQHLLIIDGQTGAIRHTYASSLAAGDIAGSPYLSSQLPASSGSGYRSLGWSPDGKYLAAGISFGASGSLQIWNMQTGAVNSTLALGNSYVISSVGWSSDGKYLAAHGYNTQGLDPSIASDIVAVWDAATHHVIFKKTIIMDGSDAPVYWQPQSHNLAFSSAANSNQDFALGIWDVLTGNELHKYAGKNSDSLAFSPDGKQLAYDGFIGNGKSPVGVIVIITVSDGTPVYTYKGSDGALAWSPDGAYIVSASGGQQLMSKSGQPVFKNGRPQTAPSYAKVWVA